MNSRLRSFWQTFVPKSYICFKEGYSFAILKKDLFAGVTVGIVSVPLTMAFAIASGLRPEQGLFTGIIAGFLISLLGGGRVQIGGPTGAFVVIIYDIVQRQGYDGLVFATLIAAVLLIVMGLCRLGTLIKYIPYPLTTGFTTGIALVIFSSQMKDFFGLKMGRVPADFIEKWDALLGAFHTFDVTTLAVSSATLASIILMRRFAPAIPWGIASIFLATLACWGLAIPVETISSHFGVLPSRLPLPTLPHFSLDLAAIHALIPDAVTIALLAGIESLLSCVIADGMTGGRHKSNCELVAQGFANLGAIFFNGLPATGAIARTAINIKTGARTPVAGMIHALVLVVILFAFMPLVGKIPLPALSAILIIIAWNMSEIHHFRHLLKSPAGDVAVMLLAFFLTVFVDLTVAVEVGMVLAAFLFMKRMGSRSGVLALSPFLKEGDNDLLEKEEIEETSKKQQPKDVEIYEINGPFFFGVADTLKDVLHNLERPPQVFILRMRRVPIIDASGLHALDEFYEQCKAEKTTLILSGVQKEPLNDLRKYGLEERIGAHNIFSRIDQALKRAQEVVGNAPR